jgi:hypothetical protein
MDFGHSFYVGLRRLLDGAKHRLKLPAFLKVFRKVC